MTTSRALRPDIHNAQFSTGDLAKAAGVTGAALQTWIRRGLIVGTGEGVDMPGQPGIRRTFSFGNLIEVAMGAALVKRGVPPREAFRAAAKFAHTGTGGRRPGLPFQNGQTLLCVDGDYSAVIPYGPDTDLRVAARTLLGDAEGFTVLLALKVFDRAMEAVGWHPEAVLEAAYGPNGGAK